MSTVAQMEDNISYMHDFKPLTSDEQATIAKAQEALAAIDSVPCTACHYCTPGCPMGIPIPEIFTALNRMFIYGDFAVAKDKYERETRGKGKASDCIHCMQCESACPQQIECTKWLEKAAELFEG